MPAFQSLLTALGWSLLDSIWQMAAVWMAYFILTGSNSRFSAAGKHNLALAFVFIGSAWFIFSFLHLMTEPPDPIIPGFIPVSQAANRRIPYLGGVYLLILAARFLNDSFIYYVRSENKRVKSISPSLQSFTDRQAILLGITRKVHVYLSDLAATAETSGFLKPLILLPGSLLTRLSPQQLEAILVHELLHIRRNDYLINLFMFCYRSIFFFNPFACLFYKAIAQERELACDDGVIEMNYAPALYAEALLNLEQFRQVRTGLTMAADGNKPWLLMERIRRLLGKPVCKKNRVTPLFLLSMLTAIGLFGLQQKNTYPNSPVQLEINHVASIPLRYETQSEKLKTVEIASASSGHQMLVKKKKLVKLPVPKLPDDESAAESKLLDRVYFAENIENRNFSNQQTAGLYQDPIHVFPGTPYVPSVSLSYDALQEITGADSVMFNLKQLESDMEKSRKQLKEMELKNRQLILLHERNIKPLLEKIHQQIKCKKEEIDQLRNRLQVSGEEIIHI